MNEQEFQAFIARYDGSLQKAWCRETSYWPEKWTPDNPALGQCAVTALAVRLLLGGTIKKVRIKRSWHYFNDDVPGVGIIDLTKRQYADYINPNTAYWGAKEVHPTTLQRNLGERFRVYWRRLLIV